jgi:hypothetical protein
VIQKNEDTVASLYRNSSIDSVDMKAIGTKQTTKESTRFHYSENSPAGESRIQRIHEQIKTYHIYASES